MTRKLTPIEMDMEVHFKLLKRYDEDLANEFAAEWDSLRVEACEIARRFSPDQPEYHIRMAQYHKRFQMMKHELLTVLGVIHHKFTTNLFIAFKKCAEVARDRNRKHQGRK